MLFEFIRKKTKGWERQREEDKMNSFLLVYVRVGGGDMNWVDQR